MESQQPSGPRDRINGVGSVPAYVAAQRMYPADRNRPYSEGTVSRMQRDMENLQTENRARALGATGGTDDHKGSLVQWFYQLGTVSASV